MDTGVWFFIFSLLVFLHIGLAYATLPSSGKRVFEMCLFKILVVSASIVLATAFTSFGGIPSEPAAIFG